MADYTQSPLFDDFTGSVVPEEVGLPESLGDKIRDWNARYRTIIPLDEAQRRASPAYNLIEALDQEGLSLVEEIASTHSAFKVRYFSEGRLQYVRSPAAPSSLSEHKSLLKPWSPEGHPGI